jgi:peroxiredoxin
VQVPGYLAKEAELKAKGISEVIVYCVNDGAVMKAWAADQKVNGTIVTFMGDTRGELTQALGMFIDHKGPRNALGSARCKRSVLICDDGVIKHVLLSEAADDPAGDNDAKGPIAAQTMVENVLKHL